eukprot:TRINITY_DN25274_c0_g1_i1.p1 TRINITY_DN25274_c0_g1~~TRINITY_DN25274_c0_g1_i1.p1  ORF type:complete len:237 (-),score=17.59 TRINITY_DN25274_c0_g1_i1:123-833(-)
MRSSQGSISKVSILYTTVGGTSRHYAECLNDSFEDTNCEATVGTLDNYEDFVRSVCVLFVIPTYDGQLPPKAQNFWLQLNSRTKPFETQRFFSIFGLGNSRLGERFCAGAKMLFNKLRELGAVPLIPLVTSCEVSIGGHENAFYKYLSGIHDALGIRLLINPTPSIEEIPLKVSYVPGLRASIPRGFSYLRVVKNILLTPPEYCFRAFTLVLSTEGVGFSYKPGDCLRIIPKKFKK